MELKEVIEKRRSIRKYDSSKKVSQDVIAEILYYAKFAPSSGNLQNWRVVIVSDQNVKAELAAAALRQKWITSAPVLMVICDDKSDVQRLYKERGRDLYSIQNISAFIQNILLLAYNQGLGTCWVGAFDPLAVQRILRIPEHITPEAIIPLGYPAEETDMPLRKTLDKFTFFERWGNTESGFGALPLEKHKAKIEEVKNKGKNFFSKLFSK